MALKERKLASSDLRSQKCEATALMGHRKRELVIQHVPGLYIGGGSGRLVHA